MERPITEVVTKMNEQWSVVTTLKRGWLMYLQCLALIAYLTPFPACRLFEQWVQWKVGLRRLRRGGGRMTAAGRPRLRPRPQRTVVKRNPSKVGSRPLLHKHALGAALHRPMIPMVILLYWWCVHCKTRLLSIDMQSKNPSIYNIIRWVAWTMRQMNRRPTVWCSKYYFFS